MARPLILLVEDEAALLRAFGRALEGAGFSVLPTASADAACAQWATHGAQVAAVVADVAMPGPPIETLFDAIDEGPHRPVRLLMSGELQGSEARARALLARTDVFLPKPLRLETLRLTLDRLLRERPQPETGA